MHYIFYIDGKLQGEPFSLPHRTRHGVIGANTTIPILRHIHSIIPCEYSRTLDETRTERTVRETGGTVTYSEHDYPEAIATVVNYDTKAVDHQADVDAMQSEALAICQDAGIDIPTSWDDGQTKLQALSDEMLALKAGLRFMKLRRKMDEVGVRWNEIVA